MNIRPGNSRSVMEPEFYQRSLPQLPQGQSKTVTSSRSHNDRQAPPRSNTSDSYVLRIYDLATHTLNGLIKQIVPWAENEKKSTPVAPALSTAQTTPVVKEIKKKVQPPPDAPPQPLPEEPAIPPETSTVVPPQARSTIDSNTVDTNGPVFVNNYYYTFNGNIDTKPFASTMVMQEAGFSPVSFPTIRPVLRYQAQKRIRTDDTIPDDSLLRIRASRTEDSHRLLGKTTNVPVHHPVVQQKPLFSSSGANTTEPKPALVGSPAPPAPASGNPFSFSAKPAVPEVKASSGFFKAGPPAVVPDDSGFAPDADDDDDDSGKKASTTAPAAPAAPAPGKFTFGMGGTTASPAPASGNPFSFSAKPAVPEVKASSGFFKAGPPAVVPDDSGFAPDADDDDDSGKKASTTAPAAPAAPAPGKFTFGMGGTTASPAPASGNAFSFSAKPAVPEVKASSGFFKAGPPAVVPDDSGFAPDADDDDDSGKKASTTAPAAPAPGKFTFGMGGTTASPAPASGNPFSFSAKPAVPEVKASSGFFKAGPPAVVPDDSGFAPDADDDDDSGKKASTTAPAAPAAPAPGKFSFGMGGTTASPAPASGNPFSFSAKPAVPEVKASSGFFKAGPPAVVPDDSGFAPDADDDDDSGKKASTTAPAAPAAPAPGKFSFGMGGTTASPAPASGNPFSFSAKPAVPFSSSSSETKPTSGFFFGSK